MGAGYDVYMDNAVAIVRAYLGVNGYFSVTEDPVLVTNKRGGFHEATDIDVLAVRLPHARGGSRSRGGSDPVTIWHDQLMDCSPNHLDLIIGEVKERASKFNSAMRKLGVLEAALRRFDCFPPSEVRALARELQAHGEVHAPHGIHVRLMLFGRHDSASPPPPARAISMGHVTGFLQDYIRTHWDTLSHGQFKDPALGFLFTLEKARRERDAQTNDEARRLPTQ